jgi:CubicO group peptidase (beta-lactamase class C family)
MRALWPIAALLFGASTSVLGCRTTDESLTSNAAISSKAFTSDGLQRVHDTMAAYVERGEVPGMVSVLSRKGEVHADTLGVSTVGGAPIRRDTIFRIASMTKPITAAATMILIEEGKLSFDERIDRWLPELAHRRVLRSIDAKLDDTVPAKRAITVRDLLSFTMGFGIVFPLDAYPVQKAAIDLHIGYGPSDPRSTPAPDEWMRRLRTLPLMSQPGERWTYNTSYDVLGVLIARVSRQTFPAFLREHIFEPLGMKDTDFSVPASKRDRFATAYIANAATGALDVFDGIEDTAWGEPPAFPSGAGGLVSTADDLLLFARMMLNGGEHAGKRILSAEAIATMTTDQLVPSQKTDDFLPGFWATHGWGFGVAVVTHSDEVTPTPGRYGWFGGLGTYWISHPEKDFAGILLTQRAFDASSPDHDFWKSVYGAMND